MYEELVYALKKCGYPGDIHYCRDCVFANDGGTCHRKKLLPAAADAIEQLSNAGSAYGRGWTLGYDAGREESKPRWIPVTERLPEVDKNVLVFACGNEITIGRMKRQTENGYHVFVICHGIARELARPGRITHWMPLPEQPEQKEKS